MKVKFRETHNSALDPIQHILDKFPSNKIIQDLMPDNGELGYRPYPTTFTDAEIWEAREYYKKLKGDNSTLYEALRKFIQACKKDERPIPGYPEFMITSAGEELWGSITTKKGKKLHKLAILTNEFVKAVNQYFQFK